MHAQIIFGFSSAGQIRPTLDNGQDFSAGKSQGIWSLLQKMIEIKELFNWWLVRAALVVDSAFFPLNFGPVVGTYEACNFLNNCPICNLLALLESSQSPLFKSWPSCPLSHTLYPIVDLWWPCLVL